MARGEPGRTAPRRRHLPGGRRRLERGHHRHQRHRNRPVGGRPRPGALRRALRAHPARLDVRRRPRPRPARRTAARDHRRERPGQHLSSRHPRSGRHGVQTGRKRTAHRASDGHRAAARGGRAPAVPAGRSGARGGLPRLARRRHRNAARGPGPAARLLRRGPHLAALPRNVCRRTDARRLAAARHRRRRPGKRRAGGPRPRRTPAPAHHRLGHGGQLGPGPEPAARRTALRPRRAPAGTQRRAARGRPLRRPHPHGHGPRRTLPRTPPASSGSSTTVRTASARRWRSRSCCRTTPGTCCRTRPRPRCSEHARRPDRTPREGEKG